MVIVVATNKKRVIEQAGILQHGSHGVHLAGHHPVYLVIAVVDDKVRV
jgi:hypothetical protein